MEGPFGSESQVSRMRKDRKLIRDFSGYEEY